MMGVMAGGIIIAVILVLVLPPVFFMTGGILSVAMGWLLRDNGEATHEGSELIELNQ